MHLDHKERKTRDLFISLFDWLRKIMRVLLVAVVDY